MSTVRITLVAVPPVAPARAGEPSRRHWAKRVTALNTSQRGGYAYLGDFLKLGVEVDVPIGAVILKVDWCGAGDQAWEQATVFTVAADGVLHECFSGHWRNDAEQVQAAAAQALASAPPALANAANLLSADLVGLTVAELVTLGGRVLAELARRSER